jgi:ribosomal protein S1
LEPEVVGLLHISRINLSQDQTPWDIYSIGDQVNVNVESIDLPRRRIRLGLAPGT